MKHLVAALLLFACVPAFAGTVTIVWTAPTACADGSDIATNCPTAGYEVYQGASITGTAYSLRETVGANVLTVTYNNIPPGTRCFFIRTKVSDTIKSDESVRACANVPFVTPGKPGSVSVTVVIPTP